MNGKQLYNKTIFKRIQIFFIIVVMAVSFIPEEIIDTYAYEISETEITDTDNTETDNTETDITESELEYQVISASPDEDDSQVITLDGLMPSNAAVSVNSLNEPPEKNLCAYDISISDNNGENFQPQNGSSIKVQITNSNIAEAVASNNKLRLWHIDDDGVREEIHNFTIQDDTITFEASGFSVYEVDDSGPALVTYKFKMPSDPANNTDYKDYYFPTSSKNADGAYKEICQQTIKNGESLIFPQLPSDMTYTFVGWFAYENDSLSETLFDFNNIPEVTETKTVELRAVFKSLAYLIFYDQYNKITEKYPVLATRRGDINPDTKKATISIEGISVVYDDQDDEKAKDQPAQMVFKGWKLREGEEDKATIEGNSCIIDSTKINDEEGIYARLEPVFEPIRWLGFYTGESGSGATYIPPVYFELDEGFSFSDRSVPVRAGYTFGGWYTEPDGGGQQVTDANQNLVSSLDTDKLEIRDGRLYVKEDIEDEQGKKIVKVNLYAKWTPTNSKYTVIIWKQKESDDIDAQSKTYDYAESYTISDNIMTGDPVSVAEGYKTKNYDGFYFSRCDDTKKVAGNGSTVLNVYYDRCTVQYKFWSSSNYYADLIDTWTGLYGQKITKYGYEWDSSKKWTYKKGTSTNITYLESFNSISSDVSNYVASSHTYTTEIYQNGDNSSYQIIHVLQDLNGNYDLSNTDLVYRTNASANSSYFTFTNKYEGFTVYGYSLGEHTPEPYNNASVNGSVYRDRKNLYVYHKRNSYTLKFVDSVNNTTYKEVQEVLYQAPIEDYKPNDPSIPPYDDNPNGYKFANWYFNEECSSNAAVDFSNTTMPNASMIIYAGWELIYYLVQIDPNGGELDDGQSTWFWRNYKSEPVSEYNTVTRNYVPDASGTYYYALHDRDYYNLGADWNESEDGISDRGASYTTDINEAKSDIKYSYLPGEYRYLGWYEVKDDGTEVPYIFGEPVTRNTRLRLHWRKLGTYYIKYDAGEGTIDNGDKNETTFQFLDADSYEDHADIVVTRVAKPPSGFNFIGWRIRNDSSGTIYYPGQSFLFASSLAEPLDYYNAVTQENETRNTIILEAVYEEIKNASIIYDANGGTIDEEEEAISNAGGALEHLFKDPNDTQEYSVTADKKQLIVKDLVNNTAVKLSNGVGFSNNGLTFVGWKDSSGRFFTSDSIKTYMVDNKEPLTLYAQWETKVYFDKNKENANWGGTWDSTKYTWDAEKEMYYTVVNLGETVGKPQCTPQYIPTSSNDDEIMFRYWSLNKSGDDMTTEPFNFSQPITQDMLGNNNYLTLYGCWDEPVKIPVHLIDTSNSTWVQHDDWLINGVGTKIILKNSTSVPLATQEESYAYADSTKLSGYKWAFACVSKNGEGYIVSEDTLIKSIWYDSGDGKVKVRYSDDSVHDFDTGNDAVYLVYYKDSTININYEYMSISGECTDITDSVIDTAPKEVDFSVTGNNPYDMQSKIADPLSYANNNYQYYSFAVGKENASSVSDLKVITNYSKSGNSLPQLSVRRVWNGFEYSLGDENWNDCGYIDLYVIYYENRPTIVNLTEKTIAMPENMSDEFEYKVKIEQKETQKVTTTFYYKRQSREEYVPINTGNYQTHTDETETPPSVIMPESKVYLSDSDIEQYVLFYSKPDITSDYIRYGNATYNAGYGNRDVYYRDTTSTEITQTITIIQTPKDNYSTANDAVSGNHIYNSSYTSPSSDSPPKTITYTNKLIPYAELNVAVIENGKIIEKNEIRTPDESIYKHGFSSISEKWNISDSSVVSPNALINNNSEYVFAGIVSGNADSNTKIVTVADESVQSLSFDEVSDGSYNLYLNDEPSNFLGEKDIYFVYVKRPEIKYVFEKPDGTYVDITPLNQDSLPYKRNGTAISQNEIIPLTDANSSQNPLLISKIYESESVFILPDELDYGNETRMIDLKCMGLGNSDEVTDVSDSTSMLLDISDSGVEYRFRESDSPQLLPENSVIYAIYKIKGYSLTINKSVTGDSGEISEFTFNISSESLTNDKYYVSGIEDTETVSVSDDKQISVKVHKDKSVTIYGLKSGIYTVSESGAGDCELFVKVDGQEKTVTNNSFSFTLNDDVSADVLNKYPIPVTNHKNTSLPYAIIITLLAAAATVMLTIRRKERISRGKSEI